jgi:hypothetical protein
VSHQSPRVEEGHVDPSVIGTARRDRGIPVLLCEE